MFIKIIESKYLTFFFVLLGILAFMIMIPSLPGPRSSINYFVAGMIIMFLSCYLGMFHYFWRREKRSTVGRLAFALLKSFTLCFILSAAFLFYEYHYGKMYGGKYYQRKALLVDGKLGLASYYTRQYEHFKGSGKFDTSLHKHQDFKNSKFIYGTAIEDEVIKKNCPDCFVDEKKFKLATYTYRDDHLIFLSIDQDKKLEMKFD